MDCGTFDVTDHLVGKMNPEALVRTLRGQHLPDPKGPVSLTEPEKVHSRVGQASVA